MLPPAPPRFSTTTGVPSASPSGVAISRAAMSVPPPAGKQAISVMVRSGHAARAPDAAVSAANAATHAAETMRHVKFRDRVTAAMKFLPQVVLVFLEYASPLGRRHAAGRAC